MLCRPVRGCRRRTPKRSPSTPVRRRSSWLCCHPPGSSSASGRTRKRTSIGACGGGPKRTATVRCRRSAKRRFVALQGCEDRRITTWSAFEYQRPEAAIEGLGLGSCKNFWPRGTCITTTSSAKPTWWVPLSGSISFAFKRDNRRIRSSSRTHRGQPSQPLRAAAGVKPASRSRPRTSPFYVVCHADAARQRREPAAPGPSSRYTKSASGLNPVSSIGTTADSTPIGGLRRSRP